LGEALTTFRSIWSFRGRAARKEFWLIIAAATLVRFLLQLLVETQADRQTAALIAIAPAGILVWVTTAAAVRRLHDRDERGWWLVPRMVLPAMVSGWLQTRGAPDTVISGLVILLALALAVWGIIALALRGTVGDNRFGPDPLAAPEAVADEFS
jgi:uncharacterized membrane protein YhaH (DUF805 family)